MLKIKNYSKKFDKEILQNINLQAKDEIVSILGKSGSGKSTILKSILNIGDFEGCISLDDINIKDKKIPVGYMSQSSSLYPWLNLIDNIILPLKILKKDIDIKLIDKTLKEFNLFEFKKYKITKLSGGMQKKAMLIRAFLLNSNFILIDEAFSSLDYFSRFEIYSYVLSLKKNRTIINVTHDVDEAILLSDRILVLSSKKPSFFLENIKINMKFRNLDFFKDKNFALYKEKVLSLMI